ncbi:Ig-like domain-containing protein [Mucilaginibacter yixingensis]|uniref:Ig-like domain-containing protein n=1 Tax=Mucilaginibacter yixingensis TaxID=1295612 RepID=UPI001473A3C7|nr:Ig-like domain-containing protein [Mucilaginibacter yixingensis]
MKRIYGILFLILMIGAFSCQKADLQSVLQSISFNDQTLNLKVGDTQTLKPVFTPDSFSTLPVVWSTGDESVVTVSQTGIIYATSPGTTWVSVKDKNSATKGKLVIVVTN